MPEVDRVSLEQLEGDFWGEAPAGESRLITRVHELRRRPVGELGIEDLRVLIGQKVGLEFLVPRALGVLEADPSAEGDFYPGDLLVAVLHVPVAYWASHASQRALLGSVLEAVEPGVVDDEIATFRSGLATP